MGKINKISAEEVGGDDEEEGEEGNFCTRFWIFVSYVVNSSFSDFVSRLNY